MTRFNDSHALSLRAIAETCEDSDAMKVGPTFMSTYGMDPHTVDWFAPIVAAIVVAAIEQELAQLTEESNA